MNEKLVVVYELVATVNFTFAMLCVAMLYGAPLLGPPALSFTEGWR
jgi:hypothetical protein